MQVRIPTKSTPSREELLERHGKHQTVGTIANKLDDIYRTGLWAVIEGPTLLRVRKEVLIEPEYYFLNRGHTFGLQCAILLSENPDATIDQTLVTFAREHGIDLKMPLGGTAYDIGSAECVGVWFQPATGILVYKEVAGNPTVKIVLPRGTSDSHYVFLTPDLRASTSEIHDLMRELGYHPRF